MILNMHLDQIRRRFDSLARKGLVYSLAPGATLEEIRTTEVRLGIEFPEQVASFWNAFNGLEVNDPPFKIMSLAEMNREEELLTFSLCDRSVRMAFDVSGRNEAGQWSILNADTNYLATLTMASFWSVHMWSWIIKRRPIWYDVHDSGGHQ
jgi:cell wall assembly regulator SMI1